MRRYKIAAATIALVITAIVVVGIAARPRAEAFTPPPSGFYVALDCDVNTPAIQSSCPVPWNHPPFDFQVGIVVGNVDQLGATINSFTFEVLANQGTFIANAGTDANLNGNPDFNQAGMSAGWNCSSPPPNPDQDPSSTVINSWLGCISSTPTTLPPGTTRTIAVVHYAAPFPQTSSDTFTLANVSITSPTSELISCNPVLVTGGPCYDATVNWYHVFPTSTPSDPNDYDNDGVPNGTDNCYYTVNPAQTNTDGNFISNAPVYANDDLTRARSDTAGDICDYDDDGDSLFDADETPSPPCGFGSTATAPLTADTDGDRVLDAAECALGFSPTSAASAPSPAACGATADADLDGLNERLEFCFYNTSPTTPDTDADGVKDGCEAASLNTDTVVNSGDQGLLAAEMVRAVPPSQKLVNFDITKDGFINSGDQGLQASRFGKCP